MANDTAAEGMILVRYLDIYKWTKDPDQIVLQKRVDVTDPKPADCTRLRVEIQIGKKWFQDPASVSAAKVKITESEPHDGINRPEDESAPLKPQGT